MSLYGSSRYAPIRQSETRKTISEKKKKKYNPIATDARQNEESVWKNSSRPGTVGGVTLTVVTTDVRGKSELRKSRRDDIFTGVKKMLFYRNDTTACLFHAILSLPDDDCADRESSVRELYDNAAAAAFGRSPPARETRRRDFPTANGGTFFFFFCIRSVLSFFVIFFFFQFLPSL